MNIPDHDSQEDTGRGIDCAAGGTLLLQVNGEPKRLPAPCTVAGLLETLALGDRRVAVAVNRDVVIRSRHRDVELSDGDHVEVLEAVGGG
jgi:sulfur carrier protein